MQEEKPKIKSLKEFLTALTIGTAMRSTGKMMAKREADKLEQKLGD